MYGERVSWARVVFVWATSAFVLKAIVFAPFTVKAIKVKTLVNIFARGRKFAPSVV